MGISIDDTYALAHEEARKENTSNVAVEISSLLIKD
jgi:hypothetical protein